jgi:hypothetical protein
MNATWQMLYLEHHVTFYIKSTYIKHMVFSKTSIELTTNNLYVISQDSNLTRVHACLCW